MLRKEMLDKRNRMTADDVRDKCKLILKTLVDLDAYKSSSNIFTYISKDKEVDTRYFIERAIYDGKAVYVPKVVSEEEMKFYRIFNLNECVVGMFNVLEPNSILKEPFDKNDSIIVVPGLVFDTMGNRIGYGRGFYDRYLSQNHFDEVIGLAYDFQIVDRIESEEHDVKMDMILTEERTVKGN